jgi:glutaredoxin 3
MSLLVALPRATELFKKGYIPMESKQATLHRMVTPEHTCPFGVASLDLLQQAGYQVEDHQLTTRSEVDSFMQAEGVETTPQTYIDGKRIGGHEELVAFLGDK